MLNIIFSREYLLEPELKCNCIYDAFEMIRIWLKSEEYDISLQTDYYLFLVYKNNFLRYRVFFILGVVEWN